MYLPEPNSGDSPENPIAEAILETLKNDLLVETDWEARKQFGIAQFSFAKEELKKTRDAERREVLNDEIREGVNTARHAERMRKLAGGIASMRTEFDDIMSGTYLMPPGDVS